MTKNQAKAKQDPEAELLLFENFLVSFFIIPSKNERPCSKECAVKEFACFNEINCKETGNKKFNIDKK